jgi:type II secretory pathway pseudopilin PulG
MNVQTVMAVLAALGLVLALLGWAYQLGRSDARTTRNEQDIAEVRQLLQTQVRASFEKVYEKIDSLPCHNPGWNKERC